MTSSRHNKRKIIFDMETGDPDDFITLLFLIGSPLVDLIGVTVTPGGADQIGLVQFTLKQFGIDIPVGSFWKPEELERNDLKTGQIKNRVSPWHRKVFWSDIPHSYDSESGCEVLNKLFTEEVTLVTGGPLKNLGALLRKYPSVARGRLFVQGGFAGDNVVPPEYRLPKFNGLITCATYNFNGDPKSAQLVVDSNVFSEKYFVSKNVCHGANYDQAFHARVKEAFDKKPTSSLFYILEGMKKYLKKNPLGKKLHDPLAACCAINPQIGKWKEVELYRQKGQWGSNLEVGSGNKIIISYDRELFIRTFTGEIK